MLARHPLATSVGLLSLGAGLLWAAGVLTQPDRFDVFDDDA